jgi:putative two-component system response regulator
MRPDEQAKILVVDDEPVNLRVLKKTLENDFRLIFAKSGPAALRLIDEEKPDIVLLDVMMPGMTGFEVCTTMKATPAIANIPVIFITALNDTVDEANGLECGAVDYITKPFSAAVVKARIKTHLSLVQVEELRRTRLQIIQRLGRASEYKDNETGMHVMRMSHYAKLIALAYGFSEIEAENLFNAAPMHDIGKIGIPDSIMLKPGRLTDEEFEIMKNHPQIGAEIIGDADSDLLQLAKEVSLTHHEKWDGSGYPTGWKGKDIPISGRIVAIADVFDALTSKRPYKTAWTVEKTMDFMHQQKGKHFDPDLLKSLDLSLPEMLKIKVKYLDDDT